MKWWCLFLIKDDAGKDIVGDYFYHLNLLMDALTWEPDSPTSPLLPLIPSREVQFAILPFLLSPCEELAFWKTLQLDSFQSALQSWSDERGGIGAFIHKSVKATFKHLLNTPEYSKQAASWCVNAVSGMMEEPKTPPADTKKPSK